MLGRLIAFAGICAILALTPGLDTALVVRNVVKKGRRAGFLAALGTATGLSIHVATVALGMATPTKLPMPMTTKRYAHCIVPTFFVSQTATRVLTPASSCSRPTTPER